MKAHECDPSNLSDVSIQNSNEHCCEQNPSADTAIVAIPVANVYMYIFPGNHTRGTWLQRLRLVQSDVLCSGLLRR